MDESIAGDERMAINGIGFACIVCDLPACFFHDDFSRRGIPWVELQFPKSVQSAGGDVTEINRRGAGPAHAACAHGEGTEFLQIIILGCMHVIGEAGRQKGFIEFWRQGYMDGGAIECGAFSLLAYKQLIPGGIIDDSDQAGALIFDADGHVIHGKAMRKVSGAV